MLCLTCLAISLQSFGQSLRPAEERSDQVRFHMPQEVRYSLEHARSETASAASKWIRAQPLDGSTNWVELGSRIIVQLDGATDLNRVIAGRPLIHARSVAKDAFLLEAPDALTAAWEADRLSTVPGVVASHPETRRRADLHGAYASLPTDAAFFLQWQLEHRQVDGSSAGVDLNVRAAWPYATGKGVIVAIGDTGLELAHPELMTNTAGRPHYSFLTDTTNGAPVNRLTVGAHGTEVAGLIGADLNHARMAGVSPEAGLASWVVVDGNQVLASDAELMAMYQYQSNQVSVENFSWGHPGLGQNPISLLEDIGISNATSFGRSGRGVIMVRSAGNDRANGGNAGDDGYRGDPRVITVGAVRIDGRAASYSDPGACLLVAAPAGDPADTNATGLFTTDLLGPDGANAFNFFPPNEDLSGYVFNSLAFSGTSAAAPQIAGLGALMLSANPNLTLHDVQGIMILASRHFDFSDPDLSTNGAGFLVSHNVGFGVPDAGTAVRLARNWTNHFSSTTVTYTSTNAATISGVGLRVLVTGPDVPPSLASIPALPSTGPQPDVPTPALPLADFGFGTTTNGFNLTGKGALIQRGTNTFAAKLNLAAQAGAAFAVVYNFLTNTTGSGAPGGDQLTAMGATDYVPIPAVFIGHTSGLALLDFFATNQTATAQLQMPSTDYLFNVTNLLICEHVGVRLMTDFPVRGDLRVTLVSPSGTRSVLQRYNADKTPGPVDWTYYSTHHFFESSAGEWKISVCNQGAEGFTGTVHLVSLILEGRPIADSDRDGLDDGWELLHFGSLNQGPKNDFDFDGYSNMREQLMGTDPAANDTVPFNIDLSRWNADFWRLSWPSSANYSYQVWGGAEPSRLSRLATMVGNFPETEWFLPAAGTNHYFRVSATTSP